MQLVLSLFGSFSAALNEEAIPPSRTKKIEALLVYLIVESAHAHRRENLMGLLFPELSDDLASTNLRQTLTRLRRVIKDNDASPPFLIITRESIQFNRQSEHWCDLLAFTALLTGCPKHPTECVESCVDCMASTRQALALYQGPFLANFFLGDSVEFEEWAATHREQLQREALTALSRLTAFHSKRGEYAQAIIYAQRYVEIEPWHEEGHQTIMRLFARMGRRIDALAQYKRCVDVLQAELDVEPSSITIALRDQIVSLTETRPYNLPAQEEPLIGRNDELAHIYALLTDVTTHLLTIVGPGGIGKTHLALSLKLSRLKLPLL